MKQLIRWHKAAFVLITNEIAFRLLDSTVYEDTYDSVWMLGPSKVALAIIITLLAYTTHRTLLKRVSAPSIRTMVTTTRAPAYFISHGGPPTMFEHQHPAYQHWLEWGKEVRALHQQGVVRGLVFVSAHWQPENLRKGVYGKCIKSLASAREH